MSVLIVPLNGYKLNSSIVKHRKLHKNYSVSEKQNKHITHTNNRPCNSHLNKQLLNIFKPVFNQKNNLQCSGALINRK